VRARKLQKSKNILHKVGSYLLELLNGTLVDTTALVDEMSCKRTSVSARSEVVDGGVFGRLLTSGGGLAGIDVADNDQVDVSLLLLTADGEIRVSLISR
jgi:hypothetical protein